MPMTTELLSSKVPLIVDKQLMNPRWFSFFAKFFFKISTQPQIFVQAVDPSANAAEGDLWVWTGVKRRESGAWVLV